jgi:acetolactate synthase I/III small subunit
MTPGPGRGADPGPPAGPGQGAGSAQQPVHAAPPPRALPGGGEARRHILVAIVNNRTGVLNRVSSLMRARNFNIETLAVSYLEDPAISRMTITIRGDDVHVEQATKQLYKLIDVLKVQDVTDEPNVQHELALVKVHATERTRGELIAIVEMYRARIVDMSPHSVIVETTGSETEVDALIALLRGYGIREMVRTGVVVMSRGPKSIEEATRR